MKIVIEGSKCSGKTTLANALNELTGAAVYHASSKTPNTLEWHVDQLMNGEDKILDRFQIGEIVYSKYYNRKPKITVREMLMMPQLAYDSLFVILYVGNNDVIFDRFRKRFEETGRTFTSAEIYEAEHADKYFEVIGNIMTLENDNVLAINTSKKSSEEVLEEVTNELRKRNLW